MKRLLVFFLFFTLCKIVYSQSIPQGLPTLTPQSPDVYALSKFAETPVSHFSGVPNVNIPIYNFKSRNINIPISLNYHGGGIKVDEIASSVGLGWSLNAGGHITRVLKGLPDEKSYLTTADKVVDYLDLINNQVGSEEPGNTQLVNLMNKVKIHKSLDYQPDEFIYNFLGYTGKFVFNQVRNSERPYGEIVMFPESEIKIDFKIDQGRIVNWEILTPDGTKYIFGVSSFSSFDTEGGAELLESTHNISTNSGGYDVNEILGYFTTWYLKEIISINNESVKFNYYVDDFGRASFNNESMKIMPKDSHSIKSYSSSEGKSSRIKSIEGINGKIVFNYSNREDSYEKKLESIEIRNNFNQLILKSNLIHNYFTTADNNKNDFIYSSYFPLSFIPLDEHLQKRLRLDEVEFLNKDLDSSNTYSYKLEYNNDYELPNRYSFAQDIWGYYNGKNNDQTLLPRVCKSNSLGSVSCSTFYVSRAVSEDHVSGGILKKIHFPEGGIQEFIFECNEKRVPTSELIGLESIFNIPSERGGVSVENSFTNNERRTFNNQYNIHEYSYSSNFSIPNEIINDNKVTIDVLNNVSGDNSGGAVYDVNFEVIKMITPLNEEIIYSSSISNSDNIIYLNPGNYKLKLNILSTFYDPINDIATVDLDWERSIPESFDIKMGGLRIKNINTYDNNGELELIKEYEYPNDIGALSMKLYTIPVFAQRIKHYDDPNNSSSFVQGVRIQSHSAHPLQNLNGKSYGYNIVKQKKISTLKPNEFIETIYEYTYNQTSLGDNTRLKGLIPNPYGWMYGSVKKIESKARKEFNAYSTFKNPNTFFPEKIAYGVNTDLYPVQGPSELELLSVPGDHENNTPSYSYRSGHLQLNNKYSTEFRGGNEIVTKENYYYETNSLKPTKIETDFGNSNITTTNNIYSNTTQNIPDLNSSVKSKLESSNRRELIVSEQDKEGVILNKQVNSFNFFNSEVYLSKVQTSKGSDSLEGRIIYHDYYANGKVKEVSKVDGTRIVYIWGYNQTQPIAKIENATFTDIPTSIYDDILSKSNLDDDTCLDSESCDEKNLRNALKVLRDDPALSDAQITTYTYDPLIGVTSITDPRGETIYYEYDGFNRLKLVKDALGNILSKNEYRYKNQ